VAPNTVRPAAPAVVRMHETNGSSAKSWDAAVLAAVALARKDLSGEVIGFEVVRLAGSVNAKGIHTYRAIVRVAYREKVSGPLAEGRA
jgi:flavin-binding protein dodecin